MKTKITTAVVILFLLNAISMWIFWISYLADFTNQNLEFSKNLSFFMATHIASELSIGIFTLISCIIYFKKMKVFSKIWFFTLGMNFYAAFQATGWAFSNGLYPVFGILLFNIALALMYLTGSMVAGTKNQLLRTVSGESGDTQKILA